MDEKSSSVSRMQLTCHARWCGMVTLSKGMAGWGAEIGSGEADMVRAAALILATGLTWMLCLASPAHADAFDGNAMYISCSATLPLDRDPEKMVEAAYNIGSCLGFVRGATALEQGRGFCLPANSNLGQLKDVYLKFLQDNPQARHRSGKLLLVAAMVQSFPCPAKVK